MLNLGIAQINLKVGDLLGNKQKILDACFQAKSKGVDLLAFPELALCSYPPEDLLHKPAFIKDQKDIIDNLYKQMPEDVFALIGFVDIDEENKLYNAVALISKEKVEGIYHKRYLPNYGVFDEKRYFSSGDTNGIFSVKGCSFGISICEDIWRDDSICKDQVAAGAQFLINISSSPYEQDKLSRREELIKSRTKACNVAIAYVNLIGGQDELIFDGASFVVNDKGDIICKMKQFEEDIDFVCFNEKIINEDKLAFPKEEEKYTALVLGVKDYFIKNGFQSAVIGLSGGIDSALVASIAVDALGKENVKCVFMPSKYTSQQSYDLVKEFVDNFDLDLLNISIDGIVASYLDQFKDVFKDKKEGVTEENIQARIRGNILMALSNKNGWLVLTTGNKSELAVGYCTLYGDMCGGFAVIKDLWKTEAFCLSRYINTVSNHSNIPEGIIERPPSAELRLDQKDEDSLPPYGVLDVILKAYIEHHLSLKEIAAVNNLDEQLVKKVINLVDRNEYKRRQAPIGIKLTSRSFGKDWRLPITNGY